MQLPAEPGENFVGLGQPLGQHHPHRIAGSHPHLLDCGQPAGGQRGRDQAEITADVVRPFEYRSVFPAPGVDLRQRIQNRRRADPQPEAASHQTQQVARLQRSGQRQEAGEEVELAALRARPFRGCDLVQRVDDCGYLQARLPIARCHHQQLLGGLAEIAGFPRRRDSLVGLDACRCRDGSHCHLLGQP